MGLFNKSVLEYETLPGFLLDYYQFKKLKRKSFSYTAWAQSLGGMNRSLLKQVVGGTRSLPAERASAFVKYFKFSSEERTHFYDLVALESGEAHKPPLKKKVRDRVRYCRHLYIVAEVEKFLDNPSIPILATLLTFKDIPCEEKFLAAVLNEDEKTVRRWFAVLENLGFIKRQDNGRWKNAKNCFRIPAQLGKEVLLNFHRKSLERALAGLQAPTDQRNFEAMLLPLGPDEYVEYLQMVNDFRAEVLARFNPDTLGDRRLFQVNWAVVPALPQR